MTLDLIREIISERICPDNCVHAVCRELKQISRELSRKSKSIPNRPLRIIEEYRESLTQQLRDIPIKVNPGSRLYTRNQLTAKLELLEQLKEEIKGEKE